MAINPKKEITHPELGAIHFRDDESPPNFSIERAPKWVCRPDNGDPDFEIYLPGDAHAPQAIDQAIVALHHRKQIETEGKNLSASNVYLAWIDLTIDPPGVAFPDNDHIYVIWKGRLSDEFRIKEFKQEAW
jgi:hypothetical protein